VNTTGKAANICGITLRRILAVTHLSIISLADRQTIRRVIRRIERDAKMRSRLFKEVAQNETLQQIMLAILAEHPDAAKEFLFELTRKPQHRRLLFIAAKGPV
jgi:DNA-binding GntR family transcriptional regulator